MKEKNYDRLRRALDALPEHAPPAAAWGDIARGLDRTAGSSLAERLPTYAPPPGVWNALSRDLDERPAATVRRLTRHHLLAAAATVALLLTAGAGLFLANRGPEVTYAYSQEPVPAAAVADWDDDETSFQRARDQVRERNEPRLNNLGQELDELTSAREEVKAMLVAYGEDPSVVRQLADIERERDDVYRRIIVEL
ncbi:hypothetical protein [Lewinella sp. IMCC34183]|uniref:hypothetical protein n=1 Tax=Lewinella sp. IMCC34183 TaxID=2248762 RepID=UPI000E24109C|nr:hypothetical protein [Lewinella sp. IMCC34183]